MTKIYKSASVEETERIAQELASELKENSVVAYFGGLGMGKTAFTRGLAKGLCIDDHVSSPTFALVNEYGEKKKLYHFDMYRISGYEDLYSTGYYDYLDSGAVLAIEWSENIEDELPEDAVRIYFERGESENERIITVKDGINEYIGD